MIPNQYVKEMGFPGSSAGKESACNAGDPSSIPGLGRSPGEGIGFPLQYSWASLMAQLVKNLPAMQETWVWSGFDLWVGKIPWKRERLPTPVFWPGKFHGPSMGLQRVGHNWTTFTFTYFKYFARVPKGFCTWFLHLLHFQLNKIKIFQSIWIYIHWVRNKANPETSPIFIFNE